MRWVPSVSSGNRCRNRIFGGVVGNGLYNFWYWLGSVLQAIPAARFGVPPTSGLRRSPKPGDANTRNPHACVSMYLRPSPQHRSKPTEPKRPLRAYTAYATSCNTVGSICSTQSWRNPFATIFKLCNGETNYGCNVLRVSCSSYRSICHTYDIAWPYAI